MILFIFIHFINIFNFLESKNIVLPFQKISIENFNGRKTIDDLISFYIYTNISMGTPPQTVAHFLEQKEYAFQFKKRMLSYNSYKSSKFFDLDNLTNFWFDKKKSSTFVQNDNENFGSDIYYFYTLNNTQVKIEDFKHNIDIKESKAKYKCGIIGLTNPKDLIINPNKVYILFINELKEKDLISEYYFTIEYNENNDLFNYNYKLNLGSIIIGERPHIYNPIKYKEKDEIVNHGIDWTILVSELKYNSINGNYIENNIEMQFNFISGFIIGTALYRKQIEKIFFSELMKNKLCIVELLEENIFPFEYNVYSCENKKIVKDNIKSFPSLYFKINQNNLTFFFTYQELFKLYNDRLYFMIIFKDEKFPSYVPHWIMGEIFLRKYLTSFNYDAKTISFYRNQVNEINIKSQVISNTNTGKNLNISKYIRVLIEIIMGLFIFFILYLLYRKYRKSRKILANELEDGNYAYIPKYNKSSELM